MVAEDSLWISLDSETWGKQPGFDGRSIGACVINPLTGDVGGHHRLFETEGGNGYEFYTAVENRLQGSYSSDHFTQQDLDQLDYRSGASRSYPLKRDPDTVDWWHNKAPTEAQAAFSNPVDLKAALIQFSGWLYSVGINEVDPNNFRIVSHGKYFDIPIIEAWYRACNLPVPWSYRAGRDTRSIFDMVDITNHSGFLRQYSVGTFHHALDDSKTQGRAICAAFAMRRDAWRNL
jgi:hypothetical protein